MQNYMLKNNTHIFKVACNTLQPTQIFINKCKNRKVSMIKQLIGEGQILCMVIINFISKQAPPSKDYGRSDLETLVQGC